MCTAKPSVAAPASTVTIPNLSRNTATSANTNRRAAIQSIYLQTGSSIQSGPASTWMTSCQMTWTANQIAGFGITPTTAPVTVDRPNAGRSRG